MLLRKALKHSGLPDAALDWLTVPVWGELLGLARQNALTVEIENPTLVCFVVVLVGCICTAHSAVIVTVVVGFARTDAGHDHRQGATSTLSRAISPRAAGSSHGLGRP